MFASIVVAALASTVAVKAAPVARAQPSNWAAGYLESYDSYHTRYLALECQDQHNTTFFDDCCHPLLSTETLADKPAYCTPNATQVASAVAYNATATASDSADGDVATEFAQATQSLDSVFSSVAAQQTSTLSVGNANAQPASTSTWVAPTTTSEAPAATTTAASSGGSGDVMTGGFATFFYQGGNAGACGNYNSDSGYGIAIDQHWWSNFGSVSDYCGKQIAITNTNNGKTVTATVWDVCPSCVSDNSLDLSVGAFTAIASESDGMVPITWQWA